MKTIHLIIAAMFVWTGTFAQQDKAESSASINQEFGVHAGATTGLGLSYRAWMGKLGAQVTALPIKTENATFISGGLTLMCTIRQHRYLHSFVYLGNHLVQTDGALKHNIGIGPGIAIGKNVGFNLMAGYGFYDIAGKFNMYPTGETGFYIKF